MNTKLNRRHFVELCAGSTAALGLSMLKLPEFEQLFAQAIKEIPVIWIQGSGDNGCSVSVLNAIPPTIQDLLLTDVVPGTHLSMRFHPTIMASQGELAEKALTDTEALGGYVMVMEGGIPTKDDGIYSTLFETASGQPIPLKDTVIRVGRGAIAAIAIGTCAASGGISRTPPNVGGVKGLSEVFKDAGISTPVINIPGCPPHPDWFVLTVAELLATGDPGSIKVDKDLRPVKFYGKLIHDQCPRRGSFNAGQFAKNFGDPDCMYELGCKGPVTHADCNDRLWNNKTKWCVEAGTTCIGCAELAFPIFKNTVGDLAALHLPTDITKPLDKAAIGIAGAVGVGAAAFGAARLLSKDKTGSGH